MSVILPQSSVKPAMWMCDPGIVAHNCARIGLPVPYYLMPGWEGAGNIVYDLLNRNNVTVNGVTWQSEGLYFDGANDYLTRTNANLAADFPGKGYSGDLTIACWVKFHDLPSVEGEDADLIDKYSTSDGQRSFRFVVSGDKLYFGLTPSGSGMTYAIGATLLQSKTWHFLVGTWDGAHIRVYLDGLLDANGANNPKTYSSSIYLGTRDFSIGCRTSANQRFFDGWMDNAIIFKHALTASQVATLYNNRYGMVELIRPPAMWRVPPVGDVAPTSIFYGPLGGSLSGPI